MQRPHLAVVLFSLAAAAARPHHGGPHYPNEDPFMSSVKRMGSLPQWPSSSSHWADVPTSFDEPSKNWKQWGAAVPIVRNVQPGHNPYQSEDAEVEPQPFKRHVDHRHFGPPAGANSFGQTEFAPSSFSVPSNQGNSFRSQVPSSFSPQSAGNYEAFDEDEEAFEERPSSFSTPQGPNNGFQRPAAFANAFPQSFEQFRQNGQPAPNSYQQQPQEPQFTSEAFRNPQGQAFQGGEEFDEGDFSIDEGEFIEDESPEFKFNAPGGASNFQFQSGPQGEDVRIQQQFGSRQNFNAPPQQEQSRPERAPPSFGQHNAPSFSYGGYDAPPQAQPPPPQSNVYYGGPQGPQGSPVSGRNQFDDIKAIGDEMIDNEYQEFNGEYERHNRGVTNQDKFNQKKKGDKKYKYKAVNYREPIQRVYDKKPEHNEEEFGTNYGAVEAYSGGYSSDKFDPEQYAKDEESNPDPGRMYDAMEEDHPQMQQYYQGNPKLRRYGQEQADDFDVEERDPDDNEEGYYVPVEAREEKEEEYEDSPSADIQKTSYNEKDGQYQEKRPEQPQPQRQSRPRSRRPYYGTDEVEKELDRNAASALPPPQQRYKRNY